MDGSRQKLIKLALARDMNCGITPWITSNPISLAQLVTRNRDESFSLQWNTSWTYRQKSIHQTLRFLLKFYSVFIKCPAFTPGLLPELFFFLLSNFVILELATWKKQPKLLQLWFNDYKVCAGLTQTGNKKNCLVTWGRKLMTWQIITVKISYTDDNTLHTSLSFLSFV